MAGACAWDRSRSVSSLGALCHTDRVGLSSLEPLLPVIGALSLGIFILAAKFVAPEVRQRGARRFEPALPRAATFVGHAAGAHWRRGLGRERLRICIDVLQVAVVAVGVTAVVVVFLCMAGLMACTLLDLP